MFDNQIDEDLEYNLLGTIVNNNQYVHLLETLPDGAFCNAYHQEVSQKLRNEDVLSADDYAYFRDGYVPKPKNAAEQLAEYARGRKLLRLIGDAHTGLRTGTPADNVFKTLAEGFESEQTTEIDTSSIAQSLSEMMVKVDLIRRGEMQLGLRSGLDFEKHLSGFEKGKLYIVAARPAMGKSAFALELTKRVAQQGNAVGFMSLEMGHESLALRLLTSIAEIDGKDLRAGNFSDEQYDKVVEYCEKLSNLPIYFDDNSYVTADSLRIKAMAMKRNHNIEMLVIDYLQLMTGSNDSRERDIAEVSRMCKVISKELEIPVIALAQLNRGVEMRDNKRPRLSDLRESGAIEQDADAVMFLYRPEYYGIERYDEDNDILGESTKNICEVIIGKNRDGETGITQQVFIPELMQFKNKAEHTPSLEQKAHTGSQSVVDEFGW